MRKWLTVGGVLLLLAWAPFFYAELTSAPTGKKGRALPTDEPGAEALVGGEAAAPEPAKPVEPNPEPQKQPEPTPAQAEAPKPTPEPSAAQPSAKTEPAEPNEPEGEARPDDEEEPPAPPPAAAGPTTVLKFAFETQPRDPLWAADTESHVKSLFRGGEIPLELLQSATCRTAVCRLELRWTRERATAYVSLYETLHKDFQGEVGVEPVGAPDDKGQEQVNLYLARKGYTVADLTK
jgi:hypothetical protein